MMKKFLILLSVMLFALTATIAFAQQATVPAAPEKKETAPAPAPTKYLSVKGEVTAVDPAKNSITIKSKRQEVQLTVTDKTKVMINKEKKSLGDVKVGDSATARYKKENEKNIATSINVTPKTEAAPAPAQAAPTKK
ncbi:MAG: hypothetical protein N2257_01130 [Thermodesulfovibrionales bacterium]|nr:hypothetical protein [Thermodesulfovibrionales bacterium]